MTDPEQPSDVERLAQVIRKIEEIRLDLRARLGHPPNGPIVGLDRMTDEDLALVRDHAAIVYGHLLAVEVPKWAAGNTGPGPRVTDEPVIYLTDEDGIGRRPEDD